MTNFNEGYVNIAGSASTHVLINGSGTYNDNTDTIEISGEIQNGGPTAEHRYVIGGHGISTKYDWYFKNKFVRDGVTIYRFVKTIRD